jgi:hypothetical protein
MKKFILFFSSTLLLATALLSARGEVYDPNRTLPQPNRDLTEDMPQLIHPFRSYFKQKNTAQYKNADWSNVVGIARGISLAEAREIAENDPYITSFFYTKGHQMVLETEGGDYRLFKRGDTVFFSGNEQWAPAPGLADSYLKLSL